MNVISKSNVTDKVLQLIEYPTYIPPSNSTYHAYDEIMSSIFVTYIYHQAILMIIIHYYCDQINTVKVTAYDGKWCNYQTLLMIGNCYHQTLIMMGNSASNTDWLWWETVTIGYCLWWETHHNTLLIMGNSPSDTVYEGKFTIRHCLWWKTHHQTLLMMGNPPSDTVLMKGNSSSDTA